MPFRRFVETGRIAKCSAGPLKGKLVAIVDVIDQRKVLVDGPESGVPRQAYRLDNMHLTKFRIKFGFNAPTRCVRKAWKAADLKTKWAETSWSQKSRAIKKRSTLNDFDRFKLRVSRSTRNKSLTVAYNKLKRYASRDGTLYGEKTIVKPTLWKDKMAKRGITKKPEKKAGGKPAVTPKAAPKAAAK